jgi:hypothetical protein
MDKFITPCELPTPREREILTILIEEAAEVQQRATKMLRFGISEVQPGQPFTNRERLGDEVGDFSAILEMAYREGVVSQDRVVIASQRKHEKLRAFMQTDAE